MTVSPTDDPMAAKLELARARALAAVAASIAHDLNNQFNAAIGLAAQLRPLVHDDDDRQLLIGLEEGTRVGSRMLGTLARMLSKGVGERADVPVVDVLEDALAIVRKSVAGAGIDLQVADADAALRVRMAPVEATQAVLQGLLAMLAAQPEQVAIRLVSAERAIADGRNRRCVGLCCEGRRMPVENVEPLLAVAQVRAGMLSRIGPTAPSLEGLAGSVLIQRRLGGELCATPLDDGVRLDYFWPSATASDVRT